VQPDGKGNLYVNTTSASRDDIQYSDQIKITHQDTELLLKVDEKSGTILWTSKYKGTCAITGKFLYAANVHVGGLAFTEGLREALNQSSGFGGGGTLRLYRMDAGSGKEKWEYFQKEAPGEIGFFENRILFNYGDRIEVLKYLSF
jgi:outer membrane protein assembly factor BamB